MQCSRATGTCQSFLRAFLACISHDSQWPSPCKGIATTRLAETRLPDATEDFRGEQELNAVRVGTSHFRGDQKNETEALKVVLHPVSGTGKSVKLCNDRFWEAWGASTRGGTRGLPCFGAGRFRRESPVKMKPREKKLAVATGAAVVWFEPNWRLTLFDLSELKERFQVKPVALLSDGSIHDMQPSRSGRGASHGP